MRVKNPSGIIMRIAIILLCLVLFSAHLASGMFARYTVAGNGTAASRAAKIDLKVTSAQTGLDDDGKYAFSVKNDSEVAFSYDLVVTFSDFSASGFHIVDYIDSVTLKDSTDTALTAAVSADGMTYTFTTGASFEADATDADSYVLTVILNPSISNNPSTYNEGNLTILNGNFKVYAVATQVD